MQSLTPSPTAWESTASILFHRLRDLRTLLTDDELRIRIQFFVVYLIMGFVSLGMSVVNLLTHWHLLMWFTILFAAANLLNAGLSQLGPRAEKTVRILFSVEILLLFTAFILTGEPQGFSAIWSVLLPTCGMLLFRMGFGSLLSLIQFLILIFLFWTKPGNSLLLFDYAESFLLRFPLLYAAFFMLGFFFEFIRYNTQKELAATRSQFEYLSNHDTLTGLYNRYGFNCLMDQFLLRAGQTGLAFAIVDLDHFKSINDTHGHQTGDMVLRHVAKDLETTLGSAGVVCRWGGEEFALLFHQPNTAEELCRQMLHQRRISGFAVGGQPFYVTASIGLILVPPGELPTASEVVTQSDRNLYQAKQTGRDRLVASPFCL